VNFCHFSFKKCFPTRRISVGLDAKGLGQTHLNLSLNLIGGVYQSGALFSYDNMPKTVNIRVGVSFRSEEQACANAESEIGSSTFEEIQAQAKALWLEKLSRIEIDIARTPPNVTEMLYSSLYRASLTPVRFVDFIFGTASDETIKNNATGETQGLFENTTSFYFDSLYCRSVKKSFWKGCGRLTYINSWDTVRHFQKVKLAMKCLP